MAQPADRRGQQRHDLQVGAPDPRIPGHRTPADPHHPPGGNQGDHRRDAPQWPVREPDRPGTPCHQRGVNEAVRNKKLPESPCTDIPVPDVVHAADFVFPEDDAQQVPAGRLDRELHQRAKAGPRVKVLTRLPGAGPFTALVILAETGDVGRFAPARTLAARAGLTPTARGSGRTIWHGHISRQGPAWLRWILREAAHSARRHPGFAAGYQAIARRRGKKIAATAIARKLLTRAWHLLTDAASGSEPR